MHTKGTTTYKTHSHDLFISKTLSTQISKRTGAHQSQQVSNGTHTLKKQTLRNNMVLGI